MIPKRFLLLPALVIAVVASQTLAQTGQQQTGRDQVVAKEDPREPNTLTDAEKEAGWRLLFDGKTTEGWRNYRRDGINEGWQVVDGALTKTSTSAGDIVTTDQFGAFELVFEYRIGEGGNSGVMYHVKETEPNPWRTGPEIQLQDNEGGHDPQKAGWLYALYPAETDATKPAGEWNEIRVLITPEKCEHYMNGVKYCEYVKGSDDWNEKVAASKFGSMENFGKADEGHLCFQGDHQGDLAFRNVRIREISGE